ncbi:MAG TPA: histidine kinase N-terminal domain-containing protein [Mycobacteriales bacterium]|jgi:two-component sensor histidine kinase|nr:histidine kinase N-terminal domain-containing protein [Mycobacteriales bacterium]
MPTMDELLVRHGVAGAGADHLHRLVADWQLLADLSFADLILFVPTGDGTLVAVAQIRPTTGPTAYQDDVVGLIAGPGERPQLLIALEERRICREGDPVWLGGVPVREEAIPVVVAEEVVAVVARDTNLAAARTPSRLEIAYLRSATDLAQMLAEGRWPEPSGGYDGAGPRVGDGLVRLDEDGTVSYASPNALSAYRRLGFLGDLHGLRLADVTAELVAPSPTPRDEPVGMIAAGRVPRLGEIEAADAIVQLRSIPLLPGGERIGALVLVHDVTEVRRRERQLMGKDATIREIHHRVKNNLQTVAALLRLQARRVDAVEARLALEESVRRVSSIAVVHETLSGTLEESVQFDEIADRVALMVVDLLAPEQVRVRRRGSFGTLPAEVATPLAMVLTELLQNAVEHGYDGVDRPGLVEIVVERSGDELRASIVDDGAGLPPGFEAAESDRLGLQIVRTLVGSELGGRLEVRPRDGGGTVATVTVSAPAASPERPEG